MILPLYLMQNSLSAILISVAAILFYLSARGQTWLRAPLPARIARRPAAALAVSAIVLGMEALHPATAVSMVVSIAMAWLIACPFIGAWLGRHRHDAQRSGAAQ